MDKSKRKKYGGRRKGTPNRATAEVRSAALALVPKAMARLERLLSSRDDGVAVRAIREVLDRAHGRPAQAITFPMPLDLRVMPSDQIQALVERLDGLIRGQQGS